MLKDHFDNTYSHVKGQHNTIMYLKKVTEENEMTRLQAERQAQEFQQQMAELQEENKRREQQIEEEKRAQQEREQRHAAEVEQLKRDIEEAKNDEEMEKLREEMEAKNKEAERQREETERAKQERDQQMKELTEKIDNMEKEQREAEEMQRAEAESLREQLEEKRIQEEENAKKNNEESWLESPSGKFLLETARDAASALFQSYLSGAFTKSSTVKESSTPSTTQAAPPRSVNIRVAAPLLQKRIPTIMQMAAIASDRRAPQFRHPLGSASRSATNPPNLAPQPSASPVD